MKKKRNIWIGSLILLALVTFWLVYNLEREMSQIEITPDKEGQLLTAIKELEDPSEWNFDDTKAFIIEYRLERDRVRSQELEMLKDIIDNPNTSEENKKEAERKLLQITDTMDKELLIENIIKARGYEDAVFFYREGIATLLVFGGEVSEEEFVRIAEIVASITGLPREEVQVIEKEI
ncbi:MAG: SpoIIIAH-like family protein [Firmicutes bacterium]|nr:SpoIIIAH-like family protein [Bacillota bacterium]